jgi:hypothetical protein
VTGHIVPASPSTRSRGGVLSFAFIGARPFRCAFRGTTNRLQPSHLLLPGTPRFPGRDGWLSRSGVCFWVSRKSSGLLFACGTGQHRSNLRANLALRLHRERH